MNKSGPRLMIIVQIYELSDETNKKVNDFESIIDKALTSMIDTEVIK